MFTPTWGDDPIWRAYFSNGLKPPIRNTLRSLRGVFVLCVLRKNGEVVRKNGACIHEILRLFPGGGSGLMPNSGANHGFVGDLIHGKFSGRKLTWNQKIQVWKMTFLLKGVILLDSSRSFSGEWYSPEKLVGGPYFGRKLLPSKKRRVWPTYVVW